MQKSVVKSKRTFDEEKDYGDVAKKIATETNWVWGTSTPPSGHVKK